MDKEDVVTIYTKEYYSTIKKYEINSICSITDGPGDYIKRSKTDREKQISHDIAYMNLFIKQKQITSPGWLHASSSHWCTGKT